MTGKPSPSAANARHVRRVGDDAVAGAGHADLVEPRPHHALVLGVHERVGAGADGDAVRLQGPQMLGRDVLVIEGDHVAAARERTQRVQVAIVADDDIADHLGRRVLRGVTEELEPDAEGDARLVGHTGELTAADHADYRERHPPRVSAARHHRPCPALGSIAPDVQTGPSPFACLRAGVAQGRWLAWLEMLIDTSTKRG